VESASSLKPELAQAEAGPAVEAERDLEFPQRETRKWVDQTGKYTLIASLLTVDGDKVCLGKEDGSTVHVPIFRLSAADRQYVKEVAPTAVTFAKVVGVTDGDTVVILDGRNLQRRVRLEGIDAPESHQAFGDRARQALAKKVFQKEVRAETCGTDKYGRTLAHLYLDTQWINKELVAEGWAWHYKKYSDNKAMADAETQARTAGVGLWADSKPIPPWEFRRMPRPEPKPTQTPAPQLAHDQAEAVTEPQPKDVTVYVTNTGAKYHRDGCRYLKSRIPMSLSEAAKCYSPCKACNPPEPGEHRDATASHTSVPTYSSPAYSPSPSSSVSSGGGTVHVKGYYRKDGTYVRPHTRSRPRR
jgi:endonuclease YncB( thermonuclease family)